MPPYPDFFVRAATADSFAIRRPVDRKYLVFVAREVHDHLAGADVKDLQRTILRRADEQSRISRKAALVDRSDVATECVDKPDSVSFLYNILAKGLCQLTCHPVHSIV